MQPYVKPSITNSIKRGIPKKRFELSEKQVENLKSVSEVILAVGTIAGTLVLTLLAPNIFQYLNKMPWARNTYRNRDTKWKDQQQKITKAIYYLKKEGYVELTPDGEDFIMKIKKKGRKKIRKLQFDSLSIPMPNQWNRRWWLVIADVPSKEYRRHADFFREKLKKMNFYPLQRTVWVFPFDPRDEVDLVAARYGIERFVTIMEVLTLDPEDGKVLNEFFRGKKIL